MALMETGYTLIVAGAALLPNVRARATGVLAAVAAGLAVAGLRAAPGGAREPGFAAAGAALLLVGALLGAAAAVSGWRRGGSRLSGTAAVGLLAGAATLLWGGRTLLRDAPALSTGLAFVVVVAAGMILLVPGRLARPGGDPGVTAHRPLAGIAGLLAGGLAVLAGPHLSVVFLGCIVAAWAGYLLQRAAGGSAVPLAPALTLLLLPAWWFMATVAGPEGLGIAALGSLPLSPAAEQLLAPILLLAAWALAGLWPLQRQMPGPLTAPIGALLVARVARPAVPDGLEHWRALAAPLVVAGIWHAALTGRLALLAIGLAWVGLLAPGGHGLAGAALLLAGALLLELARPFGAADPRRAVAVRLALGLATGCGALLAVEAALGGEVVYSVVAVAGIVSAAGRAWGAQASTASAPRTVAPSA